MDVVEVALEVGEYHFVPLGFAHLPHDGVAVDAGVVHQNVQPAEFLANGIDHALARRRTTPRGLHGQSATSQALHLADDPTGLVGVLAIR